MHKDAMPMSDQLVATVPHDPAGSGRSREQGLVLSDFLLLGGLMLALFIVDDPWNADYQEVSATRHLPLMLSVASVALANLGHALRPLPHESMPQWSIAKAGLPFWLLAGWIIAGSLVARFVNGAQDTFLNTGLYIMLTLFTARGVLIS